MLATEYSRACTLPALGKAARNLASSPFRRFTFEYAHFWQGCRHVWQLPVIRLARRISWQTYLAWTSKFKLAQQSYALLTRRVFQIIPLLSEHEYIFRTFRTGFKNPDTDGGGGGGDHGSLKYVRYSTECLQIITLFFVPNSWWVFPRYLQKVHNINRVTGTPGPSDH
jgi:hypothetical protein